MTDEWGVIRRKGVSTETTNKSPSRVPLTNFQVVIIAALTLLQLKQTTLHREKQNIHKKSISLTILIQHALITSMVHVIARRCLHERELKTVTRGTNDSPYTLNVGRVGAWIVGTVEGPRLHVQVTTTAWGKREEVSEWLLHRQISVYKLQCMNDWWWHCILTWGWGHVRCPETFLGHRWIRDKVHH